MWISVGSRNRTKAPFPYGPSVETMKGTDDR